MMRTPSGSPLDADIRMRLEMEARNPAAFSQVQLEHQLLVRQQQEFLFRQDVYQRLAWERRMQQLHQERLIQHEIQALRLIEQRNTHQGAASKDPETIHNTMKDNAIFEGIKLRCSKFTETEKNYANVLLELFDKGQIDAEEKTSSSAVLAKALHRGAEGIINNFKTAMKVYQGRRILPTSHPEYQLLRQKFQTAREKFLALVNEEWRVPVVPIAVLQDEVVAAKIETLHTKSRKTTPAKVGETIQANMDETIHNIMDDDLLFVGRKLRCGKISETEHIYADILMELFDKGQIDAEEQTPSSVVLATALHRTDEGIVNNFKTEMKIYQGRRILPRSHPEFQSLRHEFQTARAKFVALVKEEWKSLGIRQFVAAKRGETIHYNRQDMVLWKNRNVRGDKKFTETERRYANVLMELFDNGQADAKENTTSSEFLAKALHCTLERISNNMQLEEKTYIGRIFLPRSGPDYQWLKEKFQTAREWFLQVLKEEWEEDARKLDLFKDRQEQGMLHDSLADNALYRDREWRTDKLTRYEVLYIKSLVELFSRGMVDAEEKTTLRSFLAKALHCDPERILKKMKQTIPGFEKQLLECYTGRILSPKSHPDYQLMQRKFLTARESYLVTVKARWLQEDKNKWQSRMNPVPQGARECKSRNGSTPKETPPTANEELKMRRKNKSKFEKQKPTQTKAKKRPAPTEQLQKQEEKPRKRGRPSRQLKLPMRKPRMLVRTNTPRQERGTKVVKATAGKQGRSKQQGAKHAQSALEQRDDVARVSEEEKIPESEPTEEDTCLEGEYWVDSLVAKNSGEEGHADFAPTSSTQSAQHDDSSSDGLWV